LSTWGRTGDLDSLQRVGGDPHLALGDRLRRPGEPALKQLSVEVKLWLVE
jgi:hypothetical protein